MDSLMLDRRSADELAASLFEIATDPAQIESLHKILGAFCHQCRNILNSMKLSFYLAKRDQPAASENFWAELEPSYSSLELFFDRLQSICRPMTLTPIRASFGLLVDDCLPKWSAAFEKQQRSLKVIPPAEPVVGDFDPVRLPEAFDAFVTWRAIAGPENGEAYLRWSASGDQFLVEWIEHRADASLDSSSDHGEEGPFVLSLPFVARVISAHGGTLSLDSSEGLHLRMHWPIVFSPR